MRCHICGGEFDRTVTDLPFRTGGTTIVIVKGVPALECENCSEFSLPDDVMARVDQLLARVDEAAELEVVRYAA